MSHLYTCIFMSSGAPIRVFGADHNHWFMLSLSFIHLSYSKHCIKPNIVYNTGWLLVQAYEFHYFYIYFLLFLAVFLTGLDAKSLWLPAEWQHARSFSSFPQANVYSSNSFTWLTFKCLTFSPREGFPLNRCFIVQWQVQESFLFHHFCPYSCPLCDTLGDTCFQMSMFVLH